MSAAKLTLPSRPTGAVAALKLRLNCLPDASFSTMTLDSLRLYIDGADHLPYTLYELLTNNCTGILIRDPARPSAPIVELPASAIRPVGFAEDEGVLPYVRRSFLGYRLLQEYFAFPQKFLFLDVAGLGRASPRPDSEWTPRCTFLFSGVRAAETDGAVRDRRASRHVSTRLHARDQSVRRLHGAEPAGPAVERLPTDRR